MAKVIITIEDTGDETSPVELNFDLPVEPKDDEESYAMALAITFQKMLETIHVIDDDTVEKDKPE